MDPDTILAGLDAEQRQAVTDGTTPLRIVAGAGSGKTRVLTRRIAYQSAIDAIDPRKVLALTFTRKAALELGARLRQLGLRDQVTTGTFHSIAFAQLRQHWSDRGRQPPALVERKAPLVARVLPRGANDSVLDVIAEIEWAKARLVTPERYGEAAAEADRRPPLPSATIADVFAAYEAEKRKRKVVDFDDLLALCTRAIERDAEFAAAQRWRFRHLFVDEFQDVNPAQFALLSAWLGTNRDLCVVGDPRQAIYGWNGADATYMNDFAGHFNGARSIELRHNYRSTPQIVAVAHAVLPPPRALTRASHAAGPIPQVVSFADDASEAAGVVALIRSRRGSGTPLRHQAVLVRTNAQLPLFEEALRRARIPFRTRGGGLLKLPEARRLLQRIERSRGPLAPVFEALAASRHDESDPDQQPADGAPLDDALDTHRAIIDTITHLGAEYLSLDPQATGASFAAWVALTTAREHVDGDADNVELATFHAAKGLEWPIVYVAGLEQGLVPISHARLPDALAEEQRLLYVALSRAERELVCSWARERTFGARSSRRSPSPFLSDVEHAIARLDGSTRGVDHRARAAAARSQLRIPRPDAAHADDPLLAELKSWRSAQARAANVPAYVVFNDATLHAICDLRPTSRAGLSRVPGIGPVKIERYGSKLIELVKQHSP